MEILIQNRDSIHLQYRSVIVSVTDPFRFNFILVHIHVEYSITEANLLCRSKQDIDGSYPS